MGFSPCCQSSTDMSLLPRNNYLLHAFVFSNLALNRIKMQGKAFFPHGLKPILPFSILLLFTHIR